jgi:hypothetical protein
VSYEDYKERTAKWNKRLFGSVQRRRFNRDPDSYLQNLEKQWDKEHVR